MCVGLEDSLGKVRKNASGGQTLLLIVLWDKRHLAIELGATIYLCVGIDFV